MNIGAASSRSGLPTKTIRYYESIGLVSSTRRPNGFRDYDEAAVHKLAFIGCARSLGFTVDECRALLDLFEDRGRTPSEAATIAERYIKSIHRKMAMLGSLEAALAEGPDPERAFGDVPSLGWDDEEGETGSVASRGD